MFFKFPNPTMQKDRPDRDGLPDRKARCDAPGFWLGIYLPAETTRLTDAAD